MTEPEFLPEPVETEPAPPRRSWWRRLGGWLRDHAPEIAAAILARKGGQP
jgi:hypothetical protein